MALMASTLHSESGISAILKLPGMILRLSRRTEDDLVDTAFRRWFEGAGLCALRGVSANRRKRKMDMDMRLFNDMGSEASQPLFLGGGHDQQLLLVSKSRPMKQRRDDYSKRFTLHKDNQVSAGKKKGSVETPPVAYKNNSKRKTFIYGYST
jgi:hypothetical protein